MESEFTMSLMNQNLDPEIETLFLMATEAYSHLSSTLLRQIATFGGNLEKFLPPEVKQALEQRVRDMEQQQ
jgi:pantetheine-phosphate adenylyltransferase